MRSRDFCLLGFLSLVLVLLLGTALVHPDLTLGNFGDIYSYHYPLRHMAAARLEGGSLPFWNPYIFSGLPFLANSQAALFYPPSILFYVLPIRYAFTMHALLHLALAAFGAHLLFRRFGLDAFMSSTLAATFCLSPFLIYRLPQGIPTQLAALSYVPWCWLALQSERTGFLAAVWSLQFLAGHPQFLLINALGMGVHACTRPRLLKLLALSAAWASLLCLVQWAPTAQFLAQSNRADWPSVFATAYSLPPSRLATLLYPGIFGTPIDAGFSGLPSVFFETCSIYVGVVPLALAVYGAIRNARGARGAWLMAGFGFLMAMGPVLPLTRASARFSLLVVWGLILAAAGGWLELRQILRWKALRLVAFFCVLSDLGLWAARFVHAENPGPYMDPHPVLAEALSGQPFRFASSPELANPNKAMLYRAMNVNGYEAYYLRSYAYYASKAEGRPVADPSRTHISGVESPGIKKLGVAYWLGTSQISRIPGQHALAYWADGHPLQAIMRSAERWVVKGTVIPGQARRAILAVPYYPGWRAWINGRSVPVLVEDGLLQAVSLDGVEGRFRLDFRFGVPCWTLLCLISCSAWLVQLWSWRQG